MKRGKLNRKKKPIKKLKKKDILSKKTILVVVIIIAFVILMFYFLRPKKNPTKEELLKMIKERSETLTLNTPFYIIEPGLVSCWCDRADINHDGEVNMSDFQILVDNWLRNDCGGIARDTTWCNGADINHDGKVDFNDYSILADNWGRIECNEDYREGSSDYIQCQ